MNGSASARLPRRVASRTCWHDSPRRGPMAAASPGLQAYRANAHASAERALGSACPTVRALLGAEDFAHLAREFWHAHPPLRGDLGEWGDALPEWIGGPRGARRLALPRGLRAARPGAASLRARGRCRVRCSVVRTAVGRRAGAAAVATDAGRSVLGSRWPLASIHAAHAAGAGESAFDVARERLQQGQGEAVVVARDGWRGVVHRIDAPGLVFMQALVRGVDLAQALDAAGEGFDFAAWLAAALRRPLAERK